MHESNSPKVLNQETEVSLLNVIEFLQETWKKFAITAVVGVVLGLGGWFVLGTYSAEYVLLNYNYNNSYALDLLSWKMLQKSLPNLADQIINENKAPEGQASFYKELSNNQWWKKNLIPSFALSKADTKNLADISKDLDGASTTILNFTITASGASKDQAIDNVRAAANYLRSGSAYLQLRSLLSGYETQTLSMVADLQQKITTTQVEMGYQQERIRQLEDLHKRFPGGNAPTQQVVDAKDSNAKYLPLQTQIIAANNDLNGSKESLGRLQKRLDQIALAKTFLDQASSLQDQTFDGLTLDKQLLEIESNLRTNLAKDDSNGAQFLNDLHAQLVAIQVRFTKGLEANTAPTASKKGLIKSMASGLVAAFFLTLFVLLCQRVCLNVKSGGVQ